MTIATRMLCAFTALFLMPILAAAAPLGSAFTYQGQLNQSGSPVTGAVNMRFSLWDAAGTGNPPIGGVQIGASQILKNVPVTGGLFTVLVNGGGEFGGQAFSGQERWLQVEVCTDTVCSSSTVLGPRQLLSGTPYALGPWQLSGGNISFAGGNVGIGTATPGHSLTIQATAPAIGLVDNAIASQQTGYISLRTTAGETGWMGYGSAGSPDFTIANARPNGDIALWAGGERLRVDYTTGNVGIGTGTPASKLEVRGDVRMGPVGEYFAIGSGENLRIIRGKVSSTGVATTGSGYTSSRSGVGSYFLSFSPTFPPVSNNTVVTATAESSCCVRIAIINAPTHSGCFIRVVDASNTLVDANFCFTVVGPR